MSPTQPKIRVLIADDHGLMLEGLQRILEPEFDIIGTARDGKHLLETAPALDPDVILLDVSMPVLNGMEASSRLSKQLRRAKIVFVSMHSDPDYVSAAFASGASAYVLKRSASDELRTAIREVMAGRTYVSPMAPTRAERTSFNPAAVRGELTARQREVLQLVAEGRSAKQMAALLNISVKTVEFHRSCISQALGLRTTAELTRYAVERGIVGTREHLGSDHGP